MPVITEISTIRTKVLGVTDENRQGLLHDIRNHPEHVVQITVENMEVFVLFELNGMPAKFSLGTVKEKYEPFIADKIIKVKQFLITGGEAMPEYNYRCQPLGLNLVLTY